MQWLTLQWIIHKILKVVLKKSLIQALFKVKAIMCLCNSVFIDFFVKTKVIWLRLYVTLNKRLILNYHNNWHWTLVTELQFWIQDCLASTMIFFFITLSEVNAHVTRIDWNTGVTKWTIWLNINDIDRCLVC